jgi:2',3'-cyclic-nucleotide 2'-phosphodiesterase (5'-nucleotidase family)
MNHRLNKILYIYLFVITILFSPVSAVTYILYTANINGAIQNCNCGHTPLGGLDRLRSYMDDFRKNHSQTIAIDGGDFFNSYPFPELNTAMLHAIPLMNFDIMVPGENVFFESDTFVNNFLLKNNQHILISNLKNSGKSHKLFETKDSKIYIWSFLSKELVKYANKPENLIFGDLQIGKGRLSNNADFHVLVYHGIMSDLNLLLEKYPQIDLVLAAHDQAKGTIEIAGRKIVSTGRDGEVIAIIRLNREADGYEVQIEYQEIGLSLPADPKIGELIVEYKNKLVSGNTP